MPEEKRRNVIKRLYLRWHPDKNVGNDELCIEVFKHLQNEISRLERASRETSRKITRGLLGLLKLRRTMIFSSPGVTVQGASRAARRV